jgi:hypothetical protein
VQTDFLPYIFQAINNLLTQNLGFFDAMGQNLFRIFATILSPHIMKDELEMVNFARCVIGGRFPFVTQFTDNLRTWSCRHELGLSHNARS